MSTRSRAPPEYLLPSLPGYWKPTPPTNQAATFTHYPDVTGFIVESGRRFLMEAPPALTSTRYAADFNEVKAIGRVDSTTRTAEQTQMARLCHGVGTSTTSPASRLLERLSGQDNVPLQVTWDIPNAPAVTRAYNGFRHLADEEARSRVWGGIHFEFESQVSMGACALLANYAADNTLRRR